MRTKIAASLVIMAATQAHGQNQNPSRITIQQPVSCTGTVAQGSDIVMLSTTGQSGPLVPFTVDPSSGSHLMSVTSKSGRATTLLLTSSSAVVWDLRGVAAGRVVSVIVSGRGAQGVVGLPASVPVEFSDQTSSGFMSGAGPCRPIMPVNDLNSVVGSAQSVRARFGRYPDRLYSGRNAIAFDLDGGNVNLPTSIDLKPADVRTQQPLDPNAPKPSAVLLKEMMADGTLRVAGSMTMNAIRSSITPLDVQPQPMDRMEENLPPSLDPEMRARILESRRTQMMARQEAMARQMSYVPGSGMILTRKVDVLPSNPIGQNAILLPSDVPVPGNVPAGAKLYRLSIPVGQLPPKETDESMLSRYAARTEAGTVADMKVSWSGDVMSLAMPAMDANGNPAGAPMSVSPTSTADDSTSAVGMVVMAMAALAAIGGLVWYLLRRSPFGATTTRKSPQGNSRLDSLEAAARDPALKAEVKAFREEAMRLVGREGMDKDLSDEANAVLRDRFSSIADRYIATRSTSEPEAAAALDQRLSTSLREMTAKLVAIRQKQDQRNVDALAV